MFLYRKSILLLIPLSLLSIGYLSLIYQDTTKWKPVNHSNETPLETAEEWKRNFNSPKHVNSVYKQLLENIKLEGDKELERFLNTSTAVPGRKNVLFIMSDDLRPQLGTYWGTHYPNPFTNLRPHTPHLDRLASSSLLLTRAYVQYSLCAPSRASMLTGRRPDAVTTWTLRTKFREVQRNFTTLPQYFKDNGYLTVNIGKIFHRGHGWTNDDISWHIPQETSNLSPAYYTKIQNQNEVVIPITPELREGTIITPDEAFAQNGINYLRRLAPSVKSGKANFFLAVGYHRPHLMWFCPKEFFDLYPLENMDLPSNENKRYPKNYPMNISFPHPELLHWIINRTIKADDILSDEDIKFYRRAYFACVSFIDELVGMLVEEVEKLGLTDSTVIVFAGDHGYHLGENNLWGKCSTFELGNHTPLMIKIPGITDQGIVSNSLVEFVDIFPTVVEAAGLPPVPFCPRESRYVTLCSDGKSFVPLTKRPDVPLKKAAVSQLYVNKRMGYSIKTDKYRYTEWVPMNKMRVPGDVYDYLLLWDNVSEIELYDHLSDKEENINLAYDENYKSIVIQHRAILRELIPDSITHVNVSLF